MKRYFCLCPGGIKSDSDASIRIESFQEIKSMLKDLVANKYKSFETIHISNESPVKFPFWGKTYMVVGKDQKGNNMPLGYCNFKKTKASSISWLSISCWGLICLSIAMSIYACVNLRFDTAIWALNSGILAYSVKQIKGMLIRQKLMYLLK